MIEDVAAAFERNDYKQAAQLLKPLLKTSPHDPWVQLYLAKLHEVRGKSDLSEKIYRSLLKDVGNPKIALQARQGLTRLEVAAQEQRQEAIARAEETVGQLGTGFLILEPVQGDARRKAAQGFAKIMKLDPYTAQLQLPSRGWRFYRTGNMAELQVYGEELRSFGIPAFWVALSDIRKIRIFRVQHVQALTPQPVVICQDESGQIGSISFNWSEVAHRVKASLPIFEEVVDLDAWKKLTRKEKTQDYAQVVDLHLPNRNCMLRICDSTYQFQQGIQLDDRPDGSVSGSPSTTRIRWNRLIQLLEEKLSHAPVSASFTSFAETALDHLDLVETFETYVDVFRRNKTNWDSAFQIYSSLLFLHSSQENLST